MSSSKPILTPQHATGWVMSRTARTGPDSPETYEARQWLKAANVLNVIRRQMERSPYPLLPEHIAEIVAFIESEGPVARFEASSGE